MTIQVKKCFWKTNLILIMRFKKSTHLYPQVTPNLSLWCKKQQLNRLSYKVLGGDSAILHLDSRSSYNMVNSKTCYSEKRANHHTNKLNYRVFKTETVSHTNDCGGIRRVPLW